MVTIGSAFSNAQVGINRGMQNLQDSAERVANMGNSQSFNAGDLAEEAVIQMQAKMLVEASATVITRTDKALGSVIDISV